MTHPTTDMAVTGIPVSPVLLRKRSAPPTDLRPVDEEDGASPNDDSSLTAPATRYCIIGRNPTEKTVNILVPATGQIVTVRDDFLRRTDSKGHATDAETKRRSPGNKPTAPPEWNTIYYRRVHRDTLLQNPPSIYAQLRAWVREDEGPAKIIGIDPPVRVLSAAVVIPPTVEDLRDAFLQQLQRRKSRGSSTKKKPRTTVTTESATTL